MFLLAEELSGLFNNVFITNVISFTEVKKQFLNHKIYKCVLKTFYLMFVKL